MSQIQISSEQKKHFEVLFSLSEAKLQQLMQELDTAPAGVMPPALYKHLSSDIEREDLDVIIQVIISLLRLRDSTGFPSERIINDFLSLQEFENLDVSKELQEKLLQIVLNSNGAFSLTVKYLAVAIKHEKVLLSTQIITDARPLFQGDDFLGYSSVYNLIVEYRQSKNNNFIQLALDRNDLAQLKKQIESAEKRIDALKEMAVKSDTIFIDIQGG